MFMAFPVHFHFYFSAFSFAGVSLLIKSCGCSLWGCFQVLSSILSYCSFDGSGIVITSFGKRKLVSLLFFDLRRVTWVGYSVIVALGGHV